jgi:1,4-alpha-glucan branching enzyme
MDGTDVRVHQRLGAHEVFHQGVAGVDFAVWAPNAERVSVIGSFNRWDARRHMMQPRGHSGVWEIFVPGARRGDLYKFELRTKLPGNPKSVKADPCGFAMELRPNTASRVFDSRDYHWGDQKWMEQRAQRQAPDQPLLIYEVHLGSWRRDGERWLTYRELADQLIPYASDMGFTHLELMPVTEHPFDGSWGYQTVGYFAPTARFGTPDDFRHFVDCAHRAGLGVILDWVPAHFPKDGHGLGFFDGTHLYEHADPRQGLHQDWGTLIYNYGRHTVQAFLLSNALFWLEEFHIDGLRVDAVAAMLYLDYSRKPGEWVPNKLGGRENLEAVDFLQRFNDLVHAEHPGVLTFAEESTAWPKVTGPTARGGLGFDYKWNMGWMNDTLAYTRLPSPVRLASHRKLTFSLTYAFSERFLLPLSHDEVVHGKRSLLSKLPGEYDEKFAQLRALYGYMMAHPGKKLLFMGGEFGQFIEWNHDRQLDWLLLGYPLHRKLQQYVRDLNQLARQRPALHGADDSWEGFEWLSLDDAPRGIVSLLRRSRAPAQLVAVVANFSAEKHPGYRLEVPTPGAWIELLRSDATAYGGGRDASVPTRIGTRAGVDAADHRRQEPTAAGGSAARARWTLEVDLPALGVVYLAPDAAPA